ncbi:Gibberellin-regulated protein 6 [Carex littledalei]|uniref:Gibberellin-regulated protein 6 n=1 Tax=Carex littledalei TaxID=544730 RepID=A0A833QKW4_9POAL|nr:Gibberellin-regulated protein 6 [Carex littledalei]
MVAMAKLFLLLAVAILALSMAESKITRTDDAEVQYQLEKVSGGGNLQSFQCSGQCARRCSQTQYKKPCLVFCNKCCQACLCVPTGYYGNKGECPCYNNWKTKRGGPKCP